MLSMAIGHGNRPWFGHGLNMACPCLVSGPPDTRPAERAGRAGRSAGSLPGSCWAALPPRAGRPSRLVLGRQPSAVCLVLGGSPASWADCWVGAATPAGSAAGEPRSAAAGACKAPPRGGPGAGTTSCGSRTSGAGTVLGGSPACWADCWVAAAAAAGSAAGEPYPAAAGACGTPPRGSRLLGDCCHACWVGGWGAVLGGCWRGTGVGRRRRRRPAGTSASKANFYFAHGKGTRHMAGRASMAKAPGYGLGAPVPAELQAQANQVCLEPRRGEGGTASRLEKT